MKKLWVRLGLLGFVIGAIFVPYALKAEAICNDIGNCTYCDFWNGTTYAGWLKWCHPAAN